MSKKKDLDAVFNLHTVELMDCASGEISQKELQLVQEFFKKNPEKLEELKRQAKELAAVKK